MEPLNLNITLDLDAELRPRWASRDPEDEHPEPRTLAEIVVDLAARALVDDLRRDSDRWQSMRQEVAKIRTDAIRDAVLPEILAALDGPVTRTNSYGEPMGEPTTLRQMVVDEARSALTKPTKDDGYGRDKLTLVQKTVKEQVEKVLAKELTEEVEIAKATVRGAVRENTAQLLAKAVEQAVLKP